MERYRDYWTGGVLIDQIGSGSGVLWDTEGHVVTNFHVVATQSDYPLSGGFKAANVITVTTGDNQEIAARVVVARPDIDIAVLKINRLPEGLRPIPIGSASGLTIGQYVLALGNPFGNNHSLSGGVISALNRTIESPSGKHIKGVLQTDAAINPGNSGGPLLDLNGRLIGINAMIISSTGVNAKVGFAIPVDLIRGEIEDIIGASALSDIPAPQQDAGAQNRASVFKKAKDSVVFVHAETRKFDVRDNWSGNIFRLPPASGTGIVWDAKGHIVTSYSTILMSDPLTGHVSEADRLTVTLANGNTYRARIVGRSLEYHVAVLRVFAPFKDLRPLPLARAEDLKVGQDLLALGNPFGMDHSLSLGILSAERDLSANFRGVIQTDAAINPGNIGGPLLDSEGNLAGMGFFIEGPEAHSGINFALSARTLNRVVPLLLAKGQVERPALGFVSVGLAEARYFYKVEKGVLIKSVDMDSPASRAGLTGLQTSKTGGGLEPGDIIVGLRGKPIDNSEALWDLIEQEPSGAQLPFDVLRGGKRVKIVVRP
ncbi:MAG: trypsin-like peptidase domain-containing protein [Holophagales bacterium]|nr:trypsin-like peptidase domain-containing protein [Holophagales bacterium]